LHFSGADLAALTHGYTLGFLVIAAISVLGALSAAFLNIGTPPLSVGGKANDESHVIDIG
jgi:hypothetical protein